MEGAEMTQDRIEKLEMEKFGLLMQIEALEDKIELLEVEIEGYEDTVDKMCKEGFENRAKIKELEKKVRYFAETRNKARQLLLTFKEENKKLKEEGD
jgi:chromosome segregation ATPase